MADSCANSAMKITEIEGRGKGFVASGSVKAGEIVLRDSPLLLYSAITNRYATTTSTSGVSRYYYCANCFRSIVPSSSVLLSCPSCAHSAVFCSPSCHSIALSASHSTWVCKALLSLDGHPDFQVQARFLVAAYNLAFHSPSDFQLLLSLEGGRVIAQAQAQAQALALHSFIASLSPPPSSSFPPGFSFSPDLTAALLAVDKLNAFGLMEPFDGTTSQRNVRAYAIYPKASFFNHDCLPNACSFDLVDNADQHNTDIIVRAIHDISQGREICISYFPVNWNYADRQRRLMEDYGFMCHCDRCEVEANWKHDDDDDDDDGMDEDEDDPTMKGSANGHGDIGVDDFPHAYFFLNYLCDTENCSGTLAPLPPSEGAPPDVKECNVCGRFCTKEQIFDDDDEDMQDD